MLRSSLKLLRAANRVRFCQNYFYPEVHKGCLPNDKNDYTICSL